MNQFSLNVIAVSVFAMTLSALLGPAIGVSPVVPAIVTASVLGFAAIDNLIWQGNGSLILLDGLAGLSSHHRDRVLRHEAGHFLAAHQLNIPVTGYTLNAWEAFRIGVAGQGGVQFDTSELDRELQQNTLSAQLIDRYCTIWMAGSAAEHLIYNEIQGGRDDIQKLRVLLTQLRFSPAAIAQKERWAALQAKTILQEHWQTYEALVLAMQQSASVEECWQICSNKICEGASSFSEEHAKLDKENL